MLPGNLMRALRYCAQGLSLALVAVTVSPNVARGDTIYTYAKSYGTPPGQNYFQDAGERTVTDLAPAAPDNTPMKLGEPQPIGHTLEMQGGGTNVYAASKNGSSFTDSLFFTDIVAPVGEYIANVLLKEKGDYLISAGAADTFAQWSLGALSLNITEVNHDPGVLKNGKIPVDYSVSFGGEIGTPVSPTSMKFIASAADSKTGTVEVGVNFDLAGALSKAGISGYASKVSLSLDNTLNTQAQANAFAYISKKEITIAANPAAVPEPGTWVLLATAGCAGLFWLKRRSARVA